MKEILNEYNQYLYDVKNSSKNTAESYMRDVNAFIKSLSLTNINAIKKISQNQFEKYIDKLRSSGLSESTLSRNCASIRSFYAYLIQREIAVSNPTLSVKSVKATKKLPQTLTSREIDKFLCAPDSSDPKGCRDKAMLELLYASGIKVSELIALNVENVNIDAGFIVCNGKSGNRVIPLYPTAVRCISEYMRRVRGANVYEIGQPLFTNMNGERLTRQGFWKIIKIYASKVNINKDITPQTLRHSFAAHLLANGAQLKDIQEMLGHTDIASTKVYVQVVKNRFKDVYKRCHPRS